MGKSSMKMRKQKSSKKPLLIAIAALLVVGGAATWWYISHKQVANTAQTPTSAPTNTVDYNPPTEQERTNQSDQKEDILKNQENPTPPAANLSISITRAGQTSAGQAVNVRTIINGTANGTCELTFTKGASTVTKSFPISAAPTSSICNADIDANTFNESGSWNLSAVAKSGTSTSTPAVWTLTINK